MLTALTFLAILVVLFSLMVVAVSMNEFSKKMDAFRVVIEERYLIAREPKAGKKVKPLSEFIKGAPPSETTAATVGGVTINVPKPGSKV